MDTKQLMAQARFWNLVDVISHPNSQACWIWTGAKLSNGYGVFGIGSGETMLAHRWICSLREDITDKVIRHTCDNPACVRPDHLIVGDQANNIRDMYVRSRARVKLDPAAVRDIRSHRLTRDEFARMYQVSVFTVGEVQRGRTWQWVL